MRDRGWSEDEARSRIAAQASREERLAAATHVIDNTGTLEDLRQRVTEVFDELSEVDASDEVRGTRSARRSELARCYT